MSKLVREAGHVTICDPGSDRPLLSIGTTACVHCGGHFSTPRFGASPADKGSRVGRGFCQKCNGYICGPGCLECVPEEQMLENMENGKPLDYYPIIVPATIYD